DLDSAGDSDIFVARLAASSGSHVWSKRFGGVEADQGNAIAVDATGVYVTGSFRRRIDFGGSQLVSGGTEASTDDAFAVQLALADGGHIFSRRFGNTGTDRGTGVAISGDFV